MSARAGRRVPVIDAHCHAGYGDGLTGPWDTDAGLDRYNARCARAGIDVSVLIAPLTSDYRRANRDVGAMVRSRPGRYLGFAFVNPVTDAGRVALLIDEARRWGACGIKVHWRDGRITREIAEVALRHRLPVLYDPGGDTGVVETVTHAYPDVAWIVPHLSSFADDWKAQVAFVDQLVRIPNLFTDTSGVRYFDVLDDAARRAGASKILFGSDGPFLHPGVELAKVLSLPLDRRGRAAVLGGNLLRLTRSARHTHRSTRHNGPSGTPNPNRRSTPWLQP